MPPKSTLQEMIESLNRAEIVFLKKYFRGKKLEVFNEIVRKKKTDQKSLGASFRKMKAGTYLVYRSQIAKELASLLDEYRHGGNPMNELRDLQQQAASTRASGQPAKAIKILTKAVTMAEKIEEFHIAGDMLASIMLMEVEGTKEMAGFMQKRQRIAMLGAELGTIRNLEIDVEGYKMNGGAARMKLATQMQRLLSHRGEPHSKKALVSFYCAIANCHAILSEMDRCHETLVAAQTLIIGNPWMLHDEQILHSATNVHVRLSATLALDGKAREANLLLEQFVSNLKSWHIDVPSKVQFEIERTMLQMVWQDGDREKFELLSAKLLASLETTNNFSLHERRNTALVMTEQHIQAGSAAMALKWIAVAYDTRKLKTVPEAIVLIGIHELVAITMLADWERLLATLPKFDYACKSTDLLNAYTKLILDKFKEIALNPFSLKESLGILCRELERLPENSEYQFLRQLFDLSAWAISFMAQLSTPLR
jgi:hypothetical protein